MAIDGLERIFTFKGDGGTPNSYDPGDPDTYKQFIHALITDSKDYENSVLAPSATKRRNITTACCRR